MDLQLLCKIWQKVTRKGSGQRYRINTWRLKIALMEVKSIIKKLEVFPLDQFVPPASSTSRKLVRGEIQKSAAEIGQGVCESTASAIWPASHEDQEEAITEK